MIRIWLIERRRLAPAVSSCSCHVADLVTYDGGMTRHRIASGSPLEPTIGFSRAVRAGPWIAVAGTAPIGPDGAVAHPGDVYAQTRRCLEITLRAIEEAGGDAASVIRTRILLVDISTWRDAAR